MDIFEFAMKMEEDGQAYYRNLAIQAPTPGLETIFAELAADELKHYEVVRQLKNDAEVPAMADSTVLDDARTVFEALPRGVIAVKGIGDCTAAYDHAMQLEAESFRFYERAAGVENDPDRKKLLLRIAIEERKHYDILENIFNFIEAPNQRLEWGEFNNLGEFRQFGRETDS